MVWHKDRCVCGGRVWCKMSSLLGRQVDPWTWPAEEKDAWSSDSRARPRLAPWLRVRRGRTARVQILTFLGLPASVRRSHMPPFRYLQHRGDPRNWSRQSWDAAVPVRVSCLSVSAHTRLLLCPSVQTQNLCLHIGAWPSRPAPRGRSDAPLAMVPAPRSGGAKPGGR